MVNHAPAAGPIDDRIQSMALNLLALERELIHARVSVHALEELSKAVDQTRNTVWALLNSAEMTEAFIEAGLGKAVLTAHRVQRATTGNALVVEEIDAGNLSPGTKSVKELRNALAIAYKKLSRLLQQPIESD